jgi:hypothetical protein
MSLSAIFIINLNFIRVFTILVKLCWYIYWVGVPLPLIILFIKRTNGCSFLIETNLYNFSTFCEWSLHSLVMSQLCIIAELIMQHVASSSNSFLSFFYLFIFNLFFMVFCFYCSLCAILKLKFGTFSQLFIFILDKYVKNSH